MNQKQIQDYVDGRLDPQSAAQFEQAISANPALKAEVEAFRSFKLALRQAALSESVPNLQPLLADVARPQPTKWWQRSLATGIAAFALFGIFIAGQRVIENRVNPIYASAKTLPKEAHLEQKSPKKNLYTGQTETTLIQQVRASYYKPVPDLLIQGAELFAADCGNCWAGFHYKYQGEKYAVYTRCERGNLEQGSPITNQGQHLKVFNNAIGWYDKTDMTYVVVGGTPAGRQFLAQQAAKITGTSN